VTGPPDAGDTAGREAGERAVLLATKLHVPTAECRIVRRTALLDALSAGQNRKLTLVSAPAGWGKTTVLAQWAASVADTTEGPRFGWLTLDRSDNDPVWFWMYVIAALQRTSPGVGARAVELLAMGADPVQVVLPTLMNELAAIAGQIVLILDDYHQVITRAVQEQLAFVIDRMPATLRLVVVSRSDPALPLARLRASGELAEVRTSDLRFLDAEAAQLLNDVLGLGLTDTDIELLCQRTEGWAGGLYLAGLSLAGTSDTEAFIRSFAGDNRHIVDYLMAEVLDGQPPHVRSFLLRTSVLRRLSGALCDVVLETTDSASVLQRIEQDNLFLVPLDLSRRWYRYHHLFGELLRAELQHTEPELVEGLHWRAAAWFEAEGLLDEAIRHYVAAGDSAASAELVVADWVNEFNGGGLSTVSAWLDLLPAQAVSNDTRLSVARAWIALTLGRFEDARSWIDVAGRGSAAAAVDHGSFDAQLVVLGATHSFKIGDVAVAYEAAQQAITLNLDGAPLARSGAYCVYGSLLYFKGRTDEATTAFNQAVHIAEEVGDRRARIHALGYLAMIAAVRGQLADAEQQIRRATGGVTDLAESEHMVDFMVALAAATVLDARGQKTAAADAAHVALVSARRSGGVLEVANALVARAEILAHLGDQQTADANRKEAAVLLDGTDAVVLPVRHPAGQRGRDITKDLRTKHDPVNEDLTAKELEVLRLLADGMSRRDVSERLYVSFNTVKTHQRAVYRKLGVGDRTGAIKRARELGLL
jgi:LuxR family maltose regulon positive regulatory protein